MSNSLTWPYTETGWEDIPAAGDQARDIEEKPDITDERTLGAAGSWSSVGGDGNLIGWYDIPTQAGASTGALHQGGMIGGMAGLLQKVDPWKDLYKLSSTFGSSQCWDSVMAKRNRADNQAICFHECKAVSNSGEKIVQSEQLIDYILYKLGRLLIGIQLY